MPHDYSQSTSSANVDTASTTSDDGHAEEEQALLANPRVSTDSVRSLLARDPLHLSASSRETSTEASRANPLPVTLTEAFGTRLTETLVMVQAGKEDGTPVEMTSLPLRTNSRPLDAGITSTTQQVTTVSIQPERASVPPDQTDSAVARKLVARERAEAYSQGRSDANWAEPSMCIAGCACGMCLGCLGSAIGDPTGNLGFDE